MKSNWRVRLAGWFICIFSPLFFQGCGTATNPESGHIYVDHPEVFTRERLINSRLAEQAWLETQLKSDAPYSIQGSIDTREFEGFAAAVSGSFDPLGGAQAQSDIQNVQGNSRLSDLQQQLQIATLKKQIQQVENPTNVPAAPAPATNPPSSTGSVTNPMISNPVTINLGVFGSNNIPALPNPATRVGVSPGTSLTSVQTLDDQLAKRNYLEALLREQELDDTHDLAGMTLYTLKFDVSVLSGMNNPSFGQATVNIDNVDPSECLPSEDDYNRWIESLNKELLEQCISLERRFYLGYLSDEEQDDLMGVAARDLADYNNTMTADALTIKNDASMSNTDLINAATSYYNYGPSDLLESNLNYTITNQSWSAVMEESTNVFTAATNFVYTSNGKWLSTAVIYYFSTDDPAFTYTVATELHRQIAHRYSEALSNIVDIQLGDYQAVGMGSNYFYICTAHPKDGGYQAFTNQLLSLRKSWKPYVTVVEPKEYAQNLADVAARQRVMSLAASFNALIPQAATSVGLSSQYMKESQQMFDTIKRQPLLVGFANGNSQFGWVIGPKFGFDTDGKLQWSQTPVQYSVQASVVVPGWLSILSFSVTNRWLDQKGAPAPRSDLQNFAVRLPQDYSAITRAFLSQQSSASLQPSIQPRWDSLASKRQIVVEEDKPADVFIRGSDLWRNPKVYIGSQAADSVNIMPDMAGLVGHFNVIALPYSSQTGPQIADLSVVTSGGVSTLKNGVQILPAAIQTIQPFATLASTYLLSGGSLAFSIDPGVLPKSYGQLELLLTDVRNGKSTPYAITNNYPQSANWQLSVPASVLDGDSRDFKVDLRIAQTPDSTTTMTSVLKKPGFLVYFSSPAGIQFQLGTTTLTLSTNSAPVASGPIKFTFASNTNLFTEAFPNFAGTQGTLLLTNTTTFAFTNIAVVAALPEIDVNAPFAVQGNIPGTPQTWTAKLSFPNYDPLTTSGNVTVSWTK